MGKRFQHFFAKYHDFYHENHTTVNNRGAQLHPILKDPLGSPGKNLAQLVRATSALKSPLFHAPAFFCNSRVYRHPKKIFLARLASSVPPQRFSIISVGKFAQENIFVKCSNLEPILLCMLHAQKWDYIFLLEAISNSCEDAIDWNQINKVFFYCMIYWHDQMRASVKT